MEQNSRETFNDYADKYKESVQDAISFLGPELDFFTKVKVDFLIEMLETDKSQTNLKILDLGCGIGETDSFLSQRYSDITGVDISEESLQIARQNNPKVSYQLFDGKTIPFADHHFDLILLTNVMHHVPPQSWISFLSEAGRVLKKGGRLIIFEHNPYNPLTQLVVKRCPFDKDAVLIPFPKMKKLLMVTGAKKVVGHYILFFPFKNKKWRLIERYLRWLPVGAQYCSVTTF